MKMADLKSVLGNLGLTQVQTYIQSGNAIFESDEDEIPLRKKIETAIEERFGFSTTVVLRTMAELQKLLADCPFSSGAIRGVETSSPVEGLYVALLVEPPRSGAMKSLDAYSGREQKYRTIGREIFLLLPNGIRQSQLVSNMDRLGVQYTIRNWRTLNKLDELAQDIV